MKYDEEFWWVTKIFWIYFVDLNKKRRKIRKKEWKREIKGKIIEKKNVFWDFFLMGDLNILYLFRSFEIINEKEKKIEKNECLDEFLMGS